MHDALLFIFRDLKLSFFLHCRSLKTIFSPIMQIEVAEDPSLGVLIHTHYWRKLIGHLEIHS